MEKYLLSVGIPVVDTHGLMIPNYMTHQPNAGPGQPQKLRMHWVLLQCYPMGECWLLEGAMDHKGWTLLSLMLKSIILKTVIGQQPQACLVIGLVLW
jgi:hypothetical protein